MPGLKDFLFGSGPLKKAAGTADVPSAQPSQPAGIDVAKMAQDQADRVRPSGAPYPATPKSLASPMTPQKFNGKGK
jgi:hypothetical protein